MESKDLSGEESLEEKYTKRFKTSFALPTQSGNINSNYKLPEKWDGKSSQRIAKIIERI